MLQGQGFSHLWPDGILRLSAYRVPGTSAFIALGLLFGGKHVEAARLAAVIFGSFAAPFMYLFTRRVASRGEWLAAGIACVLYPTWVLSCQKRFVGAVFYSAVASIACSNRSRGLLYCLMGLSRGRCGMGELRLSSGHMARRWHC